MVVFFAAPKMWWGCISEGVVCELTSYFLCGELIKDFGYGFYFCDGCLLYLVMAFSTIDPGGKFYNA